MLDILSKQIQNIHKPSLTYDKTMGRSVHGAPNLLK